MVVLTESKPTSRLRRVVEPAVIVLITAASTILVRDSVFAVFVLVAVGSLVFGVTQFRLAQAGEAVVTIDRDHMIVVSEYGRLLLDVDLDEVRKIHFVDDKSYMTGARNMILSVHESDGTEHRVSVNAWARSRGVRWPTVLATEAARRGIVLDESSKTALFRAFPSSDAE